MMPDSSFTRALSTLNAPILPEATAAYPNASAPTIPVNNSIFIAKRTSLKDNEKFHMKLCTGVKADAQSGGVGRELQSS